MIIIILRLILKFVADPCYNYKDQSDDIKITMYDTPLNGPAFCVTHLSEGWYLFVKALGTRTSTTCVHSYKCGKANPGCLTL